MNTVGTAGAVAVTDSQLLSAPRMVDERLVGASLALHQAVAHAVARVELVVAGSSGRRSSGLVRDRVPADVPTAGTALVPTQATPYVASVQTPETGGGEISISAVSPMSARTSSAIEAAWTPRRSQSRALSGMARIVGRYSAVRLKRPLARPAEV